MIEHMWQAVAGEYTAYADYLPETHQYKVVVVYGDQEKTEMVSALYEPTFGIDVCDLDSIQEAAERMSIVFDEEAAAAARS